MVYYTNFHNNLYMLKKHPVFLSSTIFEELQKDG